jgi:uncharacterized membrane protein
MLWLKLGTGIQYLGLALMIGGLLALGAFTAPVLFKQFDRDAAGQAMTLIFRRYDWVLLAGMGMVMLGEALRFINLPFMGYPLQYGRVACVTLLAVLIGLSVFGTNAQLTRLYANQQQHTPAFHQAHKQSESLAKSQLMVAVVLNVLIAFSL